MSFHLSEHCLSNSSSHMWSYENRLRKLSFFNAAGSPLLACQVILVLISVCKPLLSVIQNLNSNPSSISVNFWASELFWASYLSKICPSSVQIYPQDHCDIMQPHMESTWHSSWYIGRAQKYMLLWSLFRTLVYWGAISAHSSTVANSISFIRWQQ